MKRHIVIFVVLLGLLAVFGTAGEDAVKVFPAKPGQRLLVDLKIGGTIVVRGWNKNQVSVEESGLDEKYLGKVLRIAVSGEEIQVKTRLSGKDFTDRGFLRNFPNRKYVVEIRVPVKFDLKLRSMGGTIVLDNIDGEISGRTMGGDLDLKKLKGIIYLKTMGGDIRLVESVLDGEVKTMGGRVLLEDVVGDIKGSSLGGNVIYRNVKKKSSKIKDKVVRISTMGGAINVDDAVNGADLHTMGGSIRVKSAQEFIKAKTMGGDIHVDSVAGWVKAKTMGGDIHVRLNPKSGSKTGDISLISMSGDITLEIPAWYSAELDIVLNIFKNGHNDYKIKSDFKLDQKKDSEWHKWHGQFKKTVRGTGKLKDGKNKVYIKTVNGNIKLKKI